MGCKRMDEAPDGGLGGTLVLPPCLAPTVDETNNLSFSSRSALLSASVCLSLYLSVFPSVSFYISLAHLSYSICGLLALFLSLSEYLSLSVSLPDSFQLLSSCSPLPPQNHFLRGGNHSSWGCQVGQAHVLMAQQVPPDSGGAGGQLQGLCSEWLPCPPFTLARSI